MDQILPYVAVFIAGAGGAALVNWLRFRKIDASTARNLNAEAMTRINDSDTNALQVSTSLLAVWIKNASDAEQKIVEYRRQGRNCTCGAFTG